MIAAFGGVYPPSGRRRAAAGSNGALSVIRRLLRRIVPLSWLSAGQLLVFELLLRADGAGSLEETGIRWARTADVPVLAQMGWPTAKVEVLLAGGATAALVERDGRLIACQWTEKARHRPFEWLCLELGPRDLWVVYTWVAPEFRGRGWFGHLRRFVASAGLTEGYERMLNAIGPENLTSLRANAKLPVRKFGSLTYLRVFGMTWVRAGSTTRARFCNSRRPLVLPLSVFSTEA